MPANSRYKTLLCVFPTVCAEMGKIWCNSNVIDHVISLQNRGNARIAEVGCWRYDRALVVLALLWWVVYLKSYAISMIILAI